MHYGGSILYWCTTIVFSIIAESICFTYCHKKHRPRISSADAESYRYEVLLVELLYTVLDVNLTNRSALNAAAAEVIDCAILYITGSNRSD